MLIKDLRIAEDLILRSKVVTQCEASHIFVLFVLKSAILCCRPSVCKIYKEVHHSHQ